MDIPVIAGAVATVVFFAASTLPMVAKAWQTKDVTSYSAGNIALADIGNVLYSVDVLAAAVRDLDWPRPRTD